MEPEGSSPCSQQPATDPYPEPDPLHNVTPYFPKIHSNIILSSTPKSSIRVVSSLQVFLSEFCIQKNWIPYIHRMKLNRKPHRAVEYKPLGCRKNWETIYT